MSQTRYHKPHPRRRLAPGYIDFTSDMAREVDVYVGTTGESLPQFEQPLARLRNYGRCSIQRELWESFKVTLEDR